MAEAGFDVLLCFELIELGIDEGFALIAVDGIRVDCFCCGDAVDGSIAANHGQGLIEGLFAFLCVFNQIIDPLLLLI